MFQKNKDYNQINTLEVQNQCYLWTDLLCLLNPTIYIEAYNLCDGSNWKYKDDFQTMIKSVFIKTLHYAHVPPIILIVACWCKVALYFLYSSFKFHLTPIWGISIIDNSIA